MTALLFSIAALIISLANPSISFFGFIRDRPKVRAHCELMWHHGFPAGGPEGGTLVLTVRIANLGRRPAVLLKLAIHGDTRQWFMDLKEPVLPPMTNENIEEVIDQYVSHRLAQNSAVRLLEGDVLDVAFWPEEGSRLTFWDDEVFEDARRLYVVDIAGDKHRVFGDAKNLARFLDASDKFLKAKAALKASKNCLSLVVRR